MSENKELDVLKRLASADPAKKVKAPKLDAAIVEQAAAAPAKQSLGQAIGERLQLAGLGLRRALLGGGVIAGATAVALVVAVGAQPRPALIYLAAAGVGGEGKAMSEADAGFLDGGRYYPGYEYEYLAGDKLSDQGGRGTIYRVVRSGSPAELLAPAAKVLGIPGTPTKDPNYDSQWGERYFMGSADWSGPILETYSTNQDGPASWWYYNPAAYPQPKCLKYGTFDETDKREPTPEPAPDASTESSGEAATSSGSSGSSGSGSASGSDGSLPAPGEYCIEYEEVKPSPSKLPSNAVVTEKALALFNATGLKVTAADISIQRSEWDVYARASLEVNGMPTSFEWTINWSQNGTLAGASGWGVAVEAAGDFDLISPKKAVERLSDWRWQGQVASSYWDQFGYANVSVSTEKSGAAVGSEEMGTDGMGTVGTPVEDDYTWTEISADDFGKDPVAPMPEVPLEPVKVTVTITDAKNALVTIWDQSGGAWLVPGYLMMQDAGGFSAIIAVVDGVIALPEPSSYDIMPMPAEDMQK